MKESTMQMPLAIMTTPDGEPVALEIVPEAVETRNSALHDQRCTPGVRRVVVYSYHDGSDWTLCAEVDGETYGGRVMRLNDGTPIGHEPFRIMASGTGMASVLEKLRYRIAMRYMAVDLYPSDRIISSPRWRDPNQQPIR